MNAVLSAPRSSPHRPFDEEFAAFATESTRRTLVIGGLSWEYFVCGRGSETVVLLPPAVGGGEVFFLLARQLAPVARVLAVGIPAVTTVSEMVRGLLELLDKERVVRAHLFGASFSGLLAQAFVRAHPERVAGMILSHTGTPAEERVRRTRRIARIIGHLPPWLIRSLLRCAVRAALPKRATERAFWIRLYGRAITHTSRRDFVARYLAAADFDATCRWTPDDLSEWRGKVLMIESTDDRIAGATTRNELARLYPSASHSVFARAGHSSYAADPYGVACVVRDFVTSTRGHHSTPTVETAGTDGSIDVLGM
jgi:pimeloyl-ACP methyl ester carboxylesterase